MENLRHQNVIENIMLSSESLINNIEMSHIMPLVETIFALIGAKENMACTAFARWP